MDEREKSTQVKGTLRFEVGSGRHGSRRRYVDPLIFVTQNQAEKAFYYRKANCLCVFLIDVTQPQP